MGDKEGFYCLRSLKDLYEVNVCPRRLRQGMSAAKSDSTTELDAILGSRSMKNVT